MPIIRTDEKNARLITAPTYHINGTSPRSHVETFLAAAHALRDALDKVAETAPHQRDYYVAPGNEWVDARGDHEKRVIMLNTMIADYEALAMHASDADQTRAHGPSFVFNGTTAYEGPR